MVVLTKVKASALLESIAATVIIMAVFVSATMIINTIFKSIVKNNNDAFTNRIEEVVYFSKHKKINVPFQEDTDFWKISITPKNNQLVLEATNKKNDKQKTVVFDAK